MTAYVPRRAACTVVRVCTVRSLRVCACGVWALFFAQRGKDAYRRRPAERIDRARPKGTPSAMLGPHSPRARTRASCCRPVSSASAREKVPVKPERYALCEGTSRKIGQGTDTARLRCLSVRDGGSAYLVEGCVLQVGPRCLYSWLYSGVYVKASSWDGTRCGQRPETR